MTKPTNFSDQFKSTTKVSEKANTDRSQETKANNERTSDYKARTEAEDQAIRSEQSDISSEKVTASDANRSENDKVIEGLMKEDLAARDQAKLGESLAKLEEKIAELTENGELEEEVAAKLSALVADLQKISESVELDAQATEKLADLANSLLTQLENPGSREALSNMVQQSDTMIELTNADYLKKIPELQKAFASAEKSVDSELAQTAGITEESLEEMPMEAVDESDRKLASEQQSGTESKKKSDSESKHQQTTNESKSTEQVARQNRTNESIQPSLRQKHEMQDGSSEISQEISTAEDVSVSGTSETNVAQETVLGAKAETIAQVVGKQSAEQKSDIGQVKDSLAAKKTETSITGNTATESGHQRSENGSQSGNGQGLGSGTNYNSSGLTSAKNATPQINHTHFSELLEKAELLKTNNGKQILSLEMSPEKLGKLEMELTSKDGVLTARISAENTLARAKLEEMASHIKESLLEQGINLSEITVDISSRNPDEQERSAMFDRKNKSRHGSISNVSNDEEIISKNILPNLRRAALNIKAVDLTV